MESLNANKVTDDANHIYGAMTPRRLFGEADFKNITRNGDTPLHMAVREGDEAKVRQLLERGANVEERDSIGMTPVHFASIYGHLNVLNILLEHGANINARTNDVLRWDGRESDSTCL